MHFVCDVAQYFVMITNALSNYNFFLKYVIIQLKFKFVLIQNQAVFNCLCK